MKTHRYPLESTIMYDPETAPAGLAMYGHMHTTGTYPINNTISYHEASGGVEAWDNPRKNRLVRAIGGTASKFVAEGGNEVGEMVTEILVGVVPGADKDAAQRLHDARLSSAAARVGSYAVAMN